MKEFPLFFRFIAIKIGQRVATLFYPDLNYYGHNGNLCFGNAKKIVGRNPKQKIVSHKSSRVSDRSDITINCRPFGLKTTFPAAIYPTKKLHEGHVLYRLLSKLMS